MPSPIKNERGIYVLPRRVPTEHASTLRGRTITIQFDGVTSSATFGPHHIKVSLRTRDAREAKRRGSIVNRELDQAIERLTSATRCLSQEQLVALSGVWYRELVQDHGSNPGDPESWRLAGDLLRDVTEYLDPHSDGADRPAFDPKLAVRLFNRGYDLDGFLARHGVKLSLNQRDEFCLVAIDALFNAYRALEHRAGGDYRPDPAAERFPVWRPATEAAVPALTFDGLVDAWLASNKGKDATGEEWRTTATQFKAFVKHDMPGDVRVADITSWIADLTEKGLSAKTIKGKKLAGMSALYGVAVGKQLLPGNPFSGYPYSVAEGLGGTRGYDDAEANKLLKAASAESDPARRWLPWLAALHGARITEMAQLRREDVTVHLGMHVLRLTGRAGRVKNKNSERVIPLHPDLERQGFLDFVNTIPSGALFYDEEKRREGAKAPQSKTLRNRLTEWIRDLGFNDPSVPPNHAWRHRFSEVASAVRADERTANVIAGWVPNTMSRKYGKVSLPAMLDALKQISASEVAGRTTGCKEQN